MENRVNKPALQMRVIPMVLAMTLAAGLTGCADDASNLIGGTTSGTTGGTTAGTTGGTTSGTTAGTTSGTTAGTTAGSTGGTTSGTTAGDTGGTTAGTTGGTTSGTTAGTTGGTTSGTTAGTTAGDTGGTTAGTTGGTTSGTTAGTTGGTTSGTTGGTTGGSTTGGDIGGIVCNPTSDTFRPIRLPNAAATSQTNGICLGCSVETPENAIDADFDTISTLVAPVGLLTGAPQLNVIDTLATYPAGRRAGFVIFDPAGPLLTLDLLQSITVVAARNGDEVDRATVPTGLSLDLLGGTLIGAGNEPQFLSFVPTADFNELRLTYSGLLATALQRVAVVQACVSVTPAVLP